MFFSKKSSKHILWNNKDILIGGSHVYYKHWFLKGIIYIQDLYKINGQFLNYEEFKQKYKLNNCFLKLNGLITCIKKLVRTEKDYNAICSGVRPNMSLDSPFFQTVDGGVIDIQKARSRIYYDVLVSEKLEQPTALRKWTEEIDISENLCKWNISSDPICTFCDRKQPEDKYHSFIQCKWTYDKIKVILDHLDPKRTWAKQINHKVWLFGVVDPAVNEIILIMKFYLHQVRSGMRRFSITGLKQEMYLRILSEKKYKSPSNFSAKWTGFEYLIEKCVSFGSDICI